MNEVKPRGDKFHVIIWDWISWSSWGIKTPFSFPENWEWVYIPQYRPFINSSFFLFSMCLVNSQFALNVRLLCLACPKYNYFKVWLLLETRGHPMVNADTQFLKLTQLTLSVSEGIICMVRYNSIFSVGIQIKASSKKKWSSSLSTRITMITCIRMHVYSFLYKFDIIK